MEDLGPHAQRLVEGLGAHRHDHELLDIQVVVGVAAAVDDVHHRNRERAGVRAADVAVQRHAEGLRGRAGGGEGHAEDGVGADVPLVLRTVEFDERVVQLDLLGGVHPDDLGGDDVVHVVDGVLYAFAQVALGVAVAQFDRLVLAGGGAGRDDGPAVYAALQEHVHFDGRVAAGVEDFTGEDVDDLGHGSTSRFSL